MSRPHTVLLGVMRHASAASLQAAVDAAWSAGVRAFDTARAYGPQPGENERWLQAALGDRPAFVVTKGGMTRSGARWVPDGRAYALADDLDRSTQALGRPPDLWLLHAPDPRVPFRTSVRALAEARASGRVARVGVCNVSLEQLDVALDYGVDAVQVGLSALDDGPVRDGVVGRCLERGVWLLAHSPLGGPKRAANLAKRAPVSALLAGVLNHGPVVSVVVGATRAEHAAALGGPLEGAADLRSAFPALRTVADRRVTAPVVDGEVVLLMGLQGSGKSTRAQAWVDAGYVRFNRDVAGGTLRGLAAEVAAALDGGVRRVVCDNTYLTRRSRADVLEVARARGVPVRGVWIDVAPDVAAANVVFRQVEAHGRLLEPVELTGKTNLSLPPSALSRSAREAELPAEDEGFATLERSPFVRAPGQGVPIRVLAPEAALTAGPDTRPTFVVAWSPNGDPPVSPWPTLVCPHGAGPPVCWCRPPLPGLLVLTARRAGGALDQSEVIGGGSAFRKMAAAVGAAWRPLGSQ